MAAQYKRSRTILSKFVISPTVVVAYQTSANQRLTRVSATSRSDDRLTFAVPGASVTTVVLSEVTVHAPPP